VSAGTPSSSTPPSSSPPSGPVATLPVGATVADAYRFTLQRIGQVAVAAVVPFVISMAATTLGAGLGAGLGGGPFEFVLGLVEVFAYAVFGVAWHRALLMQESPPVIPQLGRRQLRFWLMSLLLALLISLLVGLPAGLLIGGLGAAGAGNMAPALLIVPMAVLALYLAARFSFVFPAAAVDESFGLRESWQTTKGNGWRLIGAYILAFLPMLAAAAVLLLIGGTLLGVGGMMGGPGGAGGAGGGGEVGGIGAILFLALAAILNYVFAAIFVSVLSLAFRTCTGWIPDTTGGYGPPGPYAGPHRREGGPQDRGGPEEGRRDDAGGDEDGRDEDGDARF
jgi:hypothetical protein